MVKLKAITEDEFVLQFVRGECKAGRFKDYYEKCMSRLAVPENFLTSDEVSDKERSQWAKCLLGCVRGYPSQAIFDGFPRDVSWCMSRFTHSDLSKVRYINQREWTLRAGCARLVCDGAARMENWPDENSCVADTEAIKAIAEQGAEVETNKTRPILVGPGDAEGWVVLEGCKRLTAYFVSGSHSDVELITGASPNFGGWAFY